MATFVLRYACILIYLIPNIDSYYGIIFIIILLINFILFQIVSNMDPGYEVKKANISFMELYEKYQGDFVCAYCEIRRPRHIKHCQYCNKCVRKFDHHCPWIHNCVGEKNHKIFFVFLLMTEIDFLYSSVIGILEYCGVIYGVGLFREIFQEEPLKSGWIAASIMQGCFSGFAFCPGYPAVCGTACEYFEEYYD